MLCDNCISILFGIVLINCLAASLLCISRTLVAMGVLVQESSMMHVGYVEGTGVHAHCSVTVFTRHYANLVSSHSHLIPGLMNPA